MSSVVSYTLLLLIICSSTYSLQDPLKEIAVFKRHLGGNVSIQCATEKKNQDGVYMYRKKPEETNKQTIFYFYKDGTLTLNEDANVTIIKSGTFPSFTITFLNLTEKDNALYWCQFNLEDKITLSMVTSLWVMCMGDVMDPHPATYKKDRNTEECPEKNGFLYVTIACAVLSAIILCIICVIVKVKSSRKYEPAKSSESSVYEEMTRSKLNSMSVLINPAYQSSKQVR